MTSPTLLVENLTIDYGGFRALDSLSFSASAGDVIGIIGPNGAGKTSFIKALLSAKENLEAFAKIMGLSRGKTRRESVQKALDAVDLTHKANTKVSKLSGGMKRRINVAAAIMHDPDVLILDEPTAGADIAARDTVHRLARQIANTGKVVLLVTHELDQAEALCDKLWLTMTNASEVSFVSAFMASLRGGNDLVREISVRRPGLSHLIKHIEKTGEFPSPTRSVITPNA